MKRSCAAVFQCTDFNISLLNTGHLCAGKCVNSCLNIFLQITIEELIIIQVIDSVRKDGQTCRIVLRRNVRHLQRTAGFIDISAGQLRNFRGDLTAVIGEAGALIQTFVRRGAVGFSVQRIDSICFCAFRNHEGIVDVLGFAVEGNDDAGIIFAGSHFQVRIFIQILLGNPPADGIAGNELVCQSFVVKKILHQTKAHIRTLGKSGQDDGASLVIIFHVIEKSVPYIRISGFQIGFAVRFVIISRQGIRV